MKRFNFGKQKDHAVHKNELVPFSGFGIEGFFDDFFKDAFSGLGGLGLFTPLKTLKAPAIDVYEKDRSIMVKADLPGINKENIRLNLDGDILTISGETRKEKKEEKKGYFYQERSFGHIQRSIRLPEGVKKEDIKADYKDGVLSIYIPKSEETPRDKGRNIEIE